MGFAGLSDEELEAEVARLVALVPERSRLRVEADLRARLFAQRELSAEERLVERAARVEAEMRREAEWASRVGPGRFPENF